MEFDEFYEVGVSVTSPWKCVIVIFDEGDAFRVEFRRRIHCYNENGTGMDGKGVQENKGECDNTRKGVHSVCNAWFLGEWEWGDSHFFQISSAMSSASL